MGKGVRGLEGDTVDIATRHHFQYEEEDGCLSTAITSAIAALQGVEPASLGFRLHDYVDTEALDTLFQPKIDGTSRRGGYVKIDLPNYLVVIHSDGRITIGSRTDSESPPQSTSA